LIFQFDFLCQFIQFDPVGFRQAVEEVTGQMSACPACDANIGRVFRPSNETIEDHLNLPLLEQTGQAVEVLSQNGIGNGHLQEQTEQLIGQIEGFFLRELFCG